MVETPHAIAMQHSDEGEPSRFDASEAVAVLEGVWRAIASHHPDLPRVVLVVASGTEATNAKRWGHWAPERWQVEDGGRVGEVLLAGERMGMGGDWVLSTLLHEAAHALARVRGISDTCRGGHYHNKKYKRLAEEVGLVCSKPPRGEGPDNGWNKTELTDESRTRYSEQLSVLCTLCKRGYRHDATVPVPIGGVRGAGAGQDEGEGSDEGTAAPATTKRTGRITMTCGCDKPRKIRVMVSAAALGPNYCGLCMQEYTE